MKEMSLCVIAAFVLSLPSCVTSQAPPLPDSLISSSPSPSPTESPAVETSTGTPQTDLSTGDEALFAGDTLEKQRELFRRGYQAMQEQNRDVARRYFSRALQVYPLLADYSLHYLATLARDAGQTADAHSFFLRLLDDYPESIWTGRASVGLATLAQQEGNWTEATQYAERARASRVAITAVRQEAALVLAQAREAQGASSEAYRLYQELRATAPHSAPGATAKERVAHLRTTTPERFALQSDQDYLAEIRLLDKEGDSDGVAALTRQFRARFLSSPLQPEVLSLTAATYKKQGQVDEAVAIWRDLTTRYPDSAVAPTALYEWARLLWNKDRNAEARVVFERLSQKYPRHTQAAEAWYAIGRIFQEDNNDEQAAAAYQRLGTLFPDTALAREGRWRQGWMAYRRGNFSQAETLFADLARSALGTPEGESALYWQARSAGRQGQQEQETQGYRELLRRYPDGYYAGLVEKRLQLAPSPLEPGMEVVPTLPELSPPLQRHYRRSQELSAIGLLGFARRELDLIKDGSELDPSFARFLLSEYSRVEGHAVALRLALTLSRDGQGTWRRYLFPQAYWELATAQAKEKRLDPYFVVALIRQESLFDPEIVSPAQAYGLMQILPSTASRLTGAPVSTAALITPTFNIRTGTQYLRQLLDLYGENLIMATAAYNAGEKAVDKWRARYGDLAPDEFVESISYRETRNYVKLVMRNYRTYQRLYGGDH